jgi:hypothetical protein
MEGNMDKENCEENYECEDCHNARNEEACEKNKNCENCEFEVECHEMVKEEDCEGRKDCDGCEWEGECAFDNGYEEGCKDGYVRAMRDMANVEVQRN